MCVKKVFLFGAIFAGYVSSISFTHTRRKRVSGKDFYDDPLHDDYNNDDYTMYESYEDYEYESFSCTDGRGKIPLILLCDRVVDCSDGSDEKTINCEGSDYTTASTTVSTTVSPIAPQNTAQEVVKPALNILDDYGEYPGCLEGEFQCLSDWSVCLPTAQVCDGIDDCPAKEDELGCLGNHQGKECSSLESYQCRSRPGNCVPKHLLCDSYRDCMDGSDEERCYCGTGNFLCVNGKCVEASSRCNGIDDCGDYSDEILGCIVVLRIDQDKVSEDGQTTQPSLTKTSTAEIWSYPSLQIAVSISSLESSVTSNSSGIMESRVRICDLLPCANGGVCIETTGYFYCICRAKYTGPTCLQSLSPTKEFDSSPDAKISWSVILSSFLLSSTFQR